MSEKIVIEVGGEEQLSSQQREDAIRSVQGMAMPAIESRNRALESETLTDELANAFNGPLVALVEQDEKARRVAEEARPLLSASPDWHIDWLDTPAQIESPRDDRTFFTPPYHFPWAWHRVDGSPPNFVQHNTSAGTLTMKGSCGPLAPDSGDRFVEVHAGFGIGIRPERNGLLVAVSDRRFMKCIYELAAYGLGSWAVVEGGTECSIMSEGQWKAGESRQKFHKRVSVNERDSFESNLFGDGVMRHEIPVLAGHDYQFNVGAWLFVDNTSGVGQSGAIAAVRCEVPIMQLIAP
ncbi:hypothetical protein [Streptomyces sp. NPDC055140]